MHSCWLSLFDLCEQSAVHVVTETVFDGKRNHLTEKTFKPICLRMPFVLLSTAHSLQYLRSYGFKTFSSLWDESYDLLEGKHRYQAIMQIVRQISTSSRDNQLNLHTKVQNICVANKKLLSQYIMAQKHSKWILKLELSQNNLIHK